MKFAGILIAVALAAGVAGCQKSPPPEPNSTVETAESGPAAAPPPSHIWSYREGQEYGYSGAISEDAQKAGQAVGTVQMFRYLGEQNGVYTVGSVANGLMVTASCSDPCEVVKIFEAGAVQRVTFNPLSVVGAALTDAFHGQMEIYGSSAETAPPSPPAAVAPPSPPAPDTMAPAVATDPYATDHAAERDADGSLPSKVPAGVTRYACAFEPALSTAPLPGVGSLSYVVDESRSCINGRTAYARTKGGGLARVMLSDRDERLSVVSFSPDRQTFTRQDFMLNPSQYAAAREGGSDLIAITCPSTATPDDVSSAQARLATAHRAMRSVLSGVAVSRRMVWRCAPVDFREASRP